MSAPRAKRKHFPRAKCHGKKRFMTEIEATMAMLRIQGTSTHDVVPIRVYPCPDCHGWHLTSKPRRENGRSA